MTDGGRLGTGSTLIVRARWAASLVLILFVSDPPTRADEPPAALSIRLVDPKEQMGRVIDLFQGSRAPHPAAALAAWKRAGKGSRSLGKPAEAVVTLFNPLMARELATLDGAELRVPGLDDKTGQPRWVAVVPGDDGSLGALATALALTDGAPEEPIGKVAVVRLGAAGSPVAAGLPDRLILASDRETLRAAVEHGPRGRGPEAGQPGGAYLTLIPSALKGARSLNLRRLAAACESIGCRDVKSRLTIEGETVSLTVSSALVQADKAGPTVEPAWLDSIPLSRTLGAVSIALEPTLENLDAGFALLDRVEKTDPAFADVAPPRARLNLLAGMSGFRPDRDVWPHLRGLTAFVLADTGNGAPGGAVVLHARNDESATRFARQTFPKLTSLRLFRKDAPDRPGARVVIKGLTLAAEAVGSDVWICWGSEARDRGLKASKDFRLSAGPMIRARWGPNLPRRAGAFWPGRLRSVAAADPALEPILADGPPIIWQGRTEADALLDEVRWSGLGGLIRKVLDALPMDTSPAP